MIVSLSGCNIDVLDGDNGNRTMESIREKNGYGVCWVDALTHPDGSRSFVRCGLDGLLRFFKCGEESPLCVWAFPCSSSSSRMRVLLSCVGSRGKTLVTGSLWGNSLVSYRIPEIQKLEKTPKNSLWDESVRKGAQYIIERYNHDNYVRKLTYISDEYFASASDDKTVKIWNIGHNSLPVQPISTLTGHSNWVTNLHYDERRKVLYSCDLGGDILVHDIRISGKKCNPTNLMSVHNPDTSKGYPQERITAVTYISENHLIVGGDVGGNLFSWDERKCSGGKKDVLCFLQNFRHESTYIVALKYCRILDTLYVAQKKDLHFIDMNNTCLTKKNELRVGKNMSEEDRRKLIGIRKTVTSGQTSDPSHLAALRDFDLREPKREWDDGKEIATRDVVERLKYLRMMVEQESIVVKNVHIKKIRITTSSFSDSQQKMKKIEMSVFQIHFG